MILYSMSISYMYIHDTHKCPWSFFFLLLWWLILFPSCSFVQVVVGCSLIICKIFLEILNWFHNLCYSKFSADHLSIRCFLPFAWYSLIFWIDSFEILESLLIFCIFYLSWKIFVYYFVFIKTYSVSVGLKIFPFLIMTNNKH